MAREQLSVEYVSTNKTKSATRGWKSVCPACQGNDLWYTPATSSAYCFECGSSYRVGDAPANGYRSNTSFDINSIRDVYLQAVLLYQSYMGEREYEYLKSRGITEATAKEFGVGYCPEGNLPLYSEEGAFSSGLVARGDPSLAGRVVFPYYAAGFVTDVRGRTMGPEEPRYKSPRHPAASRGAVYPFNYDRASQRLKSGQNDLLLITEGEIKAMLADINGYACVGLPGMQNWRPGIAAILQRDVVVVFDSSFNPEDRLRVDRSIYRVSEHAPHVRVAVLPLLGEEKQDIDSFLLHPKGGKDYFDFVIKRAVDYGTYQRLRRF